jgi:cytochrome P450
MDTVFGADRYPRYAQLRVHEPVSTVIAPPGDIGGGEPMTLVSRYDHVREALSDPRLRIEPPARHQPLMNGEIPRILLNSDPPGHTRLRQAVNGLFGRHRVTALRPAVEATANRLIDALPSSGTVDLLARFALPLPLTVICELLGVPEADRAQFRGWTVQFFDADGDSAESLGHMGEYLAGLLRRKRAEPGDDLTSELLARPHDLTDPELVGTLLLLLVAGHETSTNLIGNGLLALLTHPAQLARLRHEPGLIVDAVEELLRFDSPVAHAVPRYATEDLEIGGVQIAAGSTVLLALGSANHDMTLTDGLDVSRLPSRHLAFGHGPHYCLGAPLARLEGQVAFRTLLKRLPRLALAVPANSLRWRTSLTMRGLVELPVRIFA